MHRMLLLVAAMLPGFLMGSAPALAFIDTSALEQDLESIEQGLDGDEGSIDGLLEELDEAARGDAADYLQVAVEGKSSTFWDIPKTAWFFPHVRALMELGIVSGYKDASGNSTEQFGAADPVTREQALKISFGAAGVNTASCNGEPTSEKHSPWARPYALCAATMNFGIAPGTDLTAPASRAETIHYLLRAFGVTAPEGTPPFADSTAHKYKDDIAYAYALGIVEGFKDAGGNLTGQFGPDDKVNRAAMAKMAKLAIELL